MVTASRDLERANFQRHVWELRGAFFARNALQHTKSPLLLKMGHWLSQEEGEEEFAMGPWGIFEPYDDDVLTGPWGIFE